jgi:hypothetical protein
MTSAITNTSETAMKAPISCRRTDEIRNDTGGRRPFGGMERPVESTAALESLSRTERSLTDR